MYHVSSKSIVATEHISQEPCFIDFGYSLSISAIYIYNIRSIHALLITLSAGIGDGMQLRRIYNTTFDTWINMQFWNGALCVHHMQTGQFHISYQRLYRSVLS